MTWADVSVFLMISNATSGPSRNCSLDLAWICLDSDGVLEAEIWWTGLFRIQGAGDTTPPVLSSFKMLQMVGMDRPDRSG